MGREWQLFSDADVVFTSLVRRVVRRQQIPFGRNDKDGRINSGVFFRPFGAGYITLNLSHGLRRGLHSCAASRLGEPSSSVGVEWGWWF
jgi:hypothetical protein